MVGERWGSCSGWWMVDPGAGGEGRGGMGEGGEGGGFWLVYDGGGIRIL